MQSDLRTLATLWDLGTFGFSAHLGILGHARATLSWAPFWGSFVVEFLAFSFADVSGFFALELDFLEAAFFEGRPMRNHSFCGARDPEKRCERECRRESENRPRTRHEKVTFWGSFLEPLLAPRAPLGPILEHFVAILSPLGPRGPQREAQGRPREAQEAPKGGQEVPQ